MKIDFKTATKKDVPEILKMMELFNAIDNYPFNKDITEANLFEFIADKRLGELWLIFSEKTVIGYFVLAYSYSFEHGGRDIFIDELFLMEEFRRKGVGRLAMDFIQDEVSKLGIKVMHLEVEHHNAGGNKLYKEKGFKDNGRTLLSKKIMLKT